MQQQVLSPPVHTGNVAVTVRRTVPDSDQMVLVMHGIVKTAFLQGTTAEAEDTKTDYA